MKFPDVRGGIATTSAVTLALALNGCGGSTPKESSHRAKPETSEALPLIFPTQPEALELLQKVATGYVTYEDGGRVEHEKPLERTTTIAGSIAVCLSSTELTYTSIFQQDAPWGVDTTMVYQTIRHDLAGICEGNRQLTPAKWRHYESNLHHSGHSSPIPGVQV